MYVCMYVCVAYRAMRCGNFNKRQQRRIAAWRPRRRRRRCIVVSTVIPGRERERQLRIDSLNGMADRAIRSDLCQRNATQRLMHISRWFISLLDVCHKYF